MVLLICIATTCSCGELAAMQPNDENAIRAARVRSNQAIAAHDLDGIARAQSRNDLACIRTRSGG